MTGPVGPLNNPQEDYANTIKNQPQVWGAGQMPAVKPLSPDDPFVPIAMKFFGCDQADAMVYGASLKNNLYQYIQNEIKQDDERRKREQQIEKELLDQ